MFINNLIVQFLNLKLTIFHSIEDTKLCNFVGHAPVKRSFKNVSPLLAGHWRFPICHRGDFIA
jgi:hypothetical protein